MPKRTDIKSILIIGAGPIVIGQACEFDYSGTQACKALKEEGYRIVLVNSNPATIMRYRVTTAAGTEGHTSGWADPGDGASAGKSTVAASGKAGRDGLF